MPETVWRCFGRIRSMGRVHHDGRASCVSPQIGGGSLHRPGCRFVAAGPALHHRTSQPGSGTSVLRVRPGHRTISRWPERGMNEASWTADSVAPPMDSRFRGNGGMVWAAITTFAGTAAGYGRRSRPGRKGVIPAKAGIHIPLGRRNFDVRPAPYLHRSVKCPCPGQDCFGRDCMAVVPFPGTLVGVPSRIEGLADEPSCTTRGRGGIPVLG